MPELLSLASVLARLVQRGKLERTSRGVFRIPFFPQNRLPQYRELVLGAQAHCGCRTRRQWPKTLLLHRGELREKDIQTVEGLPVTTVPKTVLDFAQANALRGRIASMERAHRSQ
jgi:hypothetical protein